MLNMTDAEILEIAQDRCPCGETGHPREQCDPDWLAEVDAASHHPVPEVNSGGKLCWDCRGLVVYGMGPFSDFARRCDAILGAAKGGNHENNIVQG